MSQFAVLHITKYKALTRIGSHIDRKHSPRHTNTAKTDFNEELLLTLGCSVDKERSHLNEELSTQKPLLPLHEAIEKRIEEGYASHRALRKDAVKALGIILSGSHQRMKQIEAQPLLFEQWKQANFLFAAQLFGKENIVRFTLHRDEKTPHFHCVVVPITPKGQLSARHFINGSHTLKRYQDLYAQAMAPFGLQRGLPASITFAQHQPTHEYYRAQHRRERDHQHLPASPALALPRPSAQQRLEAFQAAPHKHSLLYRLGFDTSAPLHGLTTALKASDKAILWGLYKDIASLDRTLVSTYTLRLNEQRALQPSFQKGLPRGLALLDAPRTPQRIVLTDSPLEALQMRQALCHKERKAFNHTLFVSTCGPLTKGLCHELDRLFKHAKEQHLPITLCLSHQAKAACLQRLQALDYPLPSQPLPAWPLNQAIAQLAMALKALSHHKPPQEEDEDEATQKLYRSSKKRI